MSRKRGRGADATGRSKVERYVRLEHWILSTAAYRSLSGDGTRILIELLRRFNGRNNSAISFSVREAESIGISKDKAARALKDLQESGFIKMAGASSFTRKSKIARTWTLTMYPVGEALATKDFVSRQCDSSSANKSKTRSHARDRLSHRCDTTTVEGNEISQTVAPVLLTSEESQPSRSHVSDTYSIPGALTPLNQPETAAAQQKIGTKPPVAAAGVLIGVNAQPPSAAHVSSPPGTETQDDAA